jgi:hypothetical protein
MNKYLRQFLQFKCAGDVINSVAPVQRFHKEITEAMAVRHELRKIVLPKPMEFNVVDLCAGNCLAGILSVFTLPVKACISIDKKDRHRQGFRDVKRWQYQKGDVYQPMSFFDGESTIMVSCHACGDLAERLINLYEEQDGVKGLVLIPCCVAPGFSHRKSLEFPDFVNDKMSQYESWCLHLVNKLNGLKLGPVKARIDKWIDSPANIVITATRGL